MNPSAQAISDPDPGGDDSIVETLARHFGVDPASARKLADSGHRSVEEVLALSRDDLASIGLEPTDIDRIHPEPETPAPAAPPPEAPSAASSKEDLVAERFLQSVQHRERGRRSRGSGGARGSADVLKRWVEGDDRAMEAWIRSSSSAPPPGAPGPSYPSAREARPEPTSAPAERPAAGSEAERTIGEFTAPSLVRALGPVSPESVGARRTESGTAGEIPERILEREKAVVGWLTELLARAKSDRFDPNSLLSELQELNREVFTERSRRGQLEEELDQVKRGSIAVIKYVRSREAASREQATRERDIEISALRLKLLQATEGGLSPTTPPPPIAAEIEARWRSEREAQEAEAAQREGALRARLAQAESEIGQLRANSSALRDREELLNEKARSLPEVVAGRLQELDARDKDLSGRENELRAKFEEIRAGANDLDRQREVLRIKEKQMGEWEVQLRTLKQTLEIEARTVEKARLEVERSGGSDPAQERRLDDLKTEIARREDELRSREQLLHQQMEELQSKIAQSDADTMHREATSEARESRMPTGVRRLDDLLFGGLPTGSQVLLNGPAHSGKEILARLFVAEGLKRGIPAIWVVTDKSYTQIRDEMTGLLPSYRELEGRGLVRYVDLYSKALGVTQPSEAGVKLLQTSDRGALEQLGQSVNAFSQELKERAPAYRLVFESVSTVTAYLDTTAMFRFLQPFTGRRRLDGAAAYYNIETGMHTDSDVETLEHMVDGSINLKLDQLKMFLSVRGITDVQSRDWVGYTFTKRAFSLGSFSLDHIR
ncbi:MAG TPA: ATPase domain-containing protein [Thermoplasmata archaeon]|nr:ATPase domain-containing protein [Thermoplasmata archaeon]